MKRSVIVLIWLMAKISAGAYELIEGELSDSRIYPATVHRYKISLPDGYDGSPACLYIGLDGVLCDAPRRIDSLIATGDLPPMIGIYIEQGVVTDSCGNVLRYNRSNEFDATDARFALFLETELLPHAVAQRSQGGLKPSIKDGGESTMIFGLSSGGIAAFTAAWHRPELIGKVFSGCGTFVPMRGGNELQAIVRKSEPRPIRVFLQDGYSDSWNPLFGSWFEANAMLGTALEFAGYDYRFDWGEGDHSLRRSNEIFPEVLKWLWRDYPAELKQPQSSNATLAGILDGAGPWQECDPVDFNMAATGAVYPDKSLVVVPRQGSNYLRQYLVDSNGGLYAGQDFYWLHGARNRDVSVWGMDFDAEGNLWVLTDSGLQVCDQNGRVRAIVRLPWYLSYLSAVEPDILPRSGGLLLMPGAVVITIDGRSFTRRLNVNPATPGVRPPSQGQG